MLRVVAKAASALAVWKYTESSSFTEQAPEYATRKGHQAQAYEQFVKAAYGVAFDLVTQLLDFGEIVTKSEVRYQSAAGGGGFVIQKMNLDPENPGLFLVPEGISVPSVVPIPPPSIENWLQLMIDLPELLEILDVN